MNTNKDKTKDRKKDKGKGRITKENIGLPQTFLHVDHKGWSAKSWIDVESPTTARRRKADYEARQINTKDPAVKAWFASNNITEADFKNPSKAVNDFIKQHGGMAAIKKEAEEFFPVEILARGTEALKAFNEAREEGETEVNQARNIFIGLERVGKTSTVNSFLGKDLNKDENITDAMMTTKLVCAHDTMWKEKSHDFSDIYDDALADEITKQVLKNPDEATAEPLKTKQRREKEEMVADKMTDGDNQAYEKDGVKENRPDAGRKRGKRQEELPENIARKVAKNIKFTRKATSGWQKTDKDFIINIWDFGGQPIYHVIQRIFLVSFAIVCVVFNLEDDLDAYANVRDPTTGKIYQHRMTNLQFILYWIRSVYTNSRDLELDNGQLCPPVLLIGTHLNSLRGSEEERKDQADEIFNKIHQALEGKPYEAMVFPTFFAIENSLPFAESNAANIMNQILKFARKMVKRLPLKWLLVQQEIQKLREKHIYLPTNEVIALVEQCGVKQEVQKVLLEYLHDLGEILYFPDDEALKYNIVLDSMRIVDMLTTIITVIDRKLREPRLRDAWRKLDKGILEEHLLRHLWKKFNFSDETFDFFVSLMQKFGLVCERKTTKGDERIFYVLSRLKPERVDTSPIDYNGKSTVSIFHDFGNYLPDDVFQRGATKFIERFQVEDSEAKLSYEHVELDIDEHHQVVLDVAAIKHRRMFQTTIIRRTILNRSNTTEKDEPSPEVCKKVLIFLDGALKIFCQSGGRGVELTMYIRCVCSPNIWDAHMHILRKFVKDVLPCGSNGMEVTRYRRLFGDNILPQGTNRPNSGLPQSQPAITKPEGFVDDAIIATVSEEMDPGWRRFGVRLGLQWSEVTRFNADERQTHHAVTKMMKFWRTNFSNEKHQRKAVCTALKQHKLRNLARKVSKGDVSDETPVIAKQADIFDDQDLLFICDNLDPESWRRLGVRLGLQWTDINGIATNNKLVKERIMEMLVTWRDGQSIHQIPTMIHAFRQQKLVQLAELVCRRHGYGLHKPLVPGFPADVGMVFIAEKLDGNWKSLGIYLGMDLCEIKQIESDFSPPMVDAIIEMLIKWRASQNAKVNQLEMMSDALNKHGRKDITEKLQTYYHNEDHIKYLPTWVEQIEVYV